MCIATHNHCGYPTTTSSSVTPNIDGLYIPSDLAVAFDEPPEPRRSHADDEQRQLSSPRRIDGRTTVAHIDVGNDHEEENVTARQRRRRHRRRTMGGETGDDAQHRTSSLLLVTRRHGRRRRRETSPAHHADNDVDLERQPQWLSLSSSSLSSNSSGEEETTPHFDNDDARHHLSSFNSSQPSNVTSTIRGTSKKLWNLFYNTILQIYLILYDIILLLSILLMSLFLYDIEIQIVHPSDNDDGEETEITAPPLRCQDWWGSGRVVIRNEHQQDQSSSHCRSQQHQQLQQHQGRFDQGESSSDSGLGVGHGYNNDAQERLERTLQRQQLRHVRDYGRESNSRHRYHGRRFRLLNLLPEGERREEEDERQWRGGRRGRSSNENGGISNYSRSLNHLRLRGGTQQQQQQRRQEGGNNTNVVVTRLGADGGERGGVGGVGGGGLNNYELMENTV